LLKSSVEPATVSFLCVLPSWLGHVYPFCEDHLINVFGTTVVVLPVLFVTLLPSVERELYSLYFFVDSVVFCLGKIYPDTVH
jgi:hypothetical protein